MRKLLAHTSKEQEERFDMALGNLEADFVSISVSLCKLTLHFLAMASSSSMLTSFWLPDQKGKSFPCDLQLGKSQRRILIALDGSGTSHLGQMCGLMLGSPQTSPVP